MVSMIALRWRGRFLFRGRDHLGQYERVALYEVVGGY